MTNKEKIREYNRNYKARQRQRARDEGRCIVCLVKPQPYSADGNHRYLTCDECDQGARARQKK